MTSELRVARLRTYPVKSLAGNDVDTALVEPWGLGGDRRWALVDAQGSNVTAREVHHLLRLRAEVVDAGRIRIVDRDGSSLVVEVPVDGPPTAVDFSRLARATAASESANVWISERIARPLRLVWQADPTQRSIAEKHGGRPGESVTLADAAPLLLATEASMRKLNDWVGEQEEALDILRFRPNVIVDGVEPFDEDHWKSVRIGEVTFRQTKICDRCVMTTIEPTSLAKGKEPIRSLARHRRWDGKTWFGIRLTPVGVSAERPQHISVGDPVEVGR